MRTDSNQLKPHLATYCLYCQSTRLPALRREDCQELAHNTVEHAAADLPPYTPFDDRSATVLQQTTATEHPRQAAATSVLAHAVLTNSMPEPPSYAERQYTTPPPERDVIHHLYPSETLSAVSLAYNVPLAVLRAHNNIASDHLIYARRMLSIPWSHYKGPSKSAEPVGGFEESERKAKLRRFMTKTKCTDYKEAENYMADAEGDLEKALNRWAEDEAWEKAHPMPETATASARGKRRAAR